MTKIRFEVTPDLSERVQEIVFASGGGWSGYTEVQCTNYPYLFIDKNKNLVYSDNDEVFTTSPFKEIAAYDFIASQGEQEWLPKYGEEALFSGDNSTWEKLIFNRYNISSKYPFRTTNRTNYKYCKSLPKQVSFIQFLKDRNAYEAYMENTKIENQRWTKIEEYKTLIEIKSLDKSSWIIEAFRWDKQKQEPGYWGKLVNKWESIYKKNDVVWETK